jgi:hypothetical protein
MNSLTRNRFGLSLPGIAACRRDLLHSHGLSASVTWVKVRCGAKQEREQKVPPIVTRAICYKI